MRAPDRADDLPTDDCHDTSTVFADPITYLRLLGIEAELVECPQAGPLPVAA